MRISDWSSDVCSSDLHPFGIAPAARPENRDRPFFDPCPDRLQLCLEFLAVAAVEVREDNDARTIGRQIGRASCRERVCQTCRSRWSPYHAKKTQHTMTLTEEQPCITIETEKKR